MLKYLRLCIRELTGNLSFSLFFIFNLALGLVGFGLLDSFRISFQHQIDSQNREIMGADFKIKANQPLPPEIHTIVTEKFNQIARSEKVEFFSMVQANNVSRLVNIHAIDKAFPLVGKFGLEGPNVSDDVSIGELLSQSPTCYLYPELAELLGVGIGDSIKLGHAEFKVAGWVKQDPSALFSNLGLAPRLFISLDQVKNTGLIQLGSRVQYTSYYASDDAQMTYKQYIRLKLTILSKLKQSDSYQITQAKEASARINRGMGDLSRFLSLVAMVALFLAGTGAAFIYRAYISSRIRSIAILISQGMSHTKVSIYYLLQLTFLGLLGSFIAIMLVYALLPIVSKALAVFLPRELELRMALSTYGLIVLMGGVGSLIFCLPFLTRIRLIKARQLFQEGNAERLEIPKFDPWFLIASLVLVMGAYAFSCMQAGSIKIGSIFFVGISVGIVIMAAICQSILWSARRLMHKLSLIWRMALKDLVRKRMSTLTSFLCIGVGSLLIALMPQMQKNLELRLQKPEGFTLPTFFIFDMQPEQLDTITKTAADFKAQLKHISPMINARVDKIKGIDLRKYVIQNQSGEMKRGFGPMLMRRGANLSYRPALADSEKVLKGEPLSKLEAYDWQKPVPLSLETRFAEELNLEIGDKILFDIQGLPLEGVVQNTRKVSWNSFQPNFFIIMPQGVLEEAPMTVLATITGLKNDDKMLFQKRVLQQAPNISFVDVQDVIQKVLYVLDQLSIAVYLLAGLAILSGLVVLYSIARYEVKMEAWMFSLLKVLGADFNLLRKWIIVRFGILGFTASVVGIFLSMGFAYIFWVFVVKDSWYWVIQDIIILCPIVTAVCVLTALMASQKILTSRPKLFLDAR